MLDEREKKKHIMELLLLSLEKRDDGMASNIQDILQGAGAGVGATDHIISFWKSRNPTELARARMIDILAQKNNGETYEKSMALTFLLSHLNDESPLVKQHLSGAIGSFAPESISPLIDLLMTPGEITPGIRQAAAILIKIGEPSVLPVCHALDAAHERRTNGLIHVLSQLRDPRAIPYLINHLYRIAPHHTKLACHVIQVLSSFRSREVIPPLITMLKFPDDRLSETAIEELSNLGEISVESLIHALDVEHEAIITRRIHLVFIKMQPFPQARLLDAFQQSDRVAGHIKETFKQHAAATASYLIDNLFHPHKRIRHYTRLTLAEMNPAATFPHLIEALVQPGWQPVIKEYLLTDISAIPLLISKLSSTTISDEVFTTLLAFDSRQITPWVMRGLYDSKTRQETKHLIVTLANREQQQSLVPDIVRLFDPAVSNMQTLPSESLNALQEVLTSELARESLPELINCLDGKLLDLCSDTLVILSLKPDMTETVVHETIAALSRGGLMHGARQTLVKIGKPALRPISLLLDSDEPWLVEAAQDILSEMGANAFPIIYQRFHNPGTETVAAHIYNKMPASVVAAGLAAYLSSKDLFMTEIAVYLLYARIEAEDQQRKIELIPALLAQTRKNNISIRRIIAPLLLYSGSTANSRRRLAAHVVDHLLKHPERHLEFMGVFSFIGEQSIKPLEKIVRETNISSQLLPEAIAMLGLLSRHERNEQIEQYVAELASLKPIMRGQRTRQLLNPLDYRALGGLPASGRYDYTELSNLKRQADSQGDVPASEFYDVLIGTRNIPKIDLLTRRWQESEDRTNLLQQDVDRLTRDVKSERERSERLRKERNEAREQRNDVIKERDIAWDANKRLHDAYKDLERQSHNHP